MARSLTVVRNATAQANTGQTDLVSVPGFARFMTVFIDVSATAGTSPLFDFKMQYVDPVRNAAVEDFPGVGITQIAGNDNVVIQVGPGVTGIADDDTTAVYTLNMALPPLINFVTTLDRGSANETYTYSISCAFSD
jgi:hypothetical protein